MSEFWFAPVNEDGTYGEPQKLEGVTEITPVTEPSVDEFMVNLLKYEGVGIDPDFGLKAEIFLWYYERKADRDCLTCRNCKEMYRYPGYVTAETCVCTQGLECDTVLYEVKNCPKWEYKPFNEPRQRNPDLDKYPHDYIIEGE